MDNFEIYGQLSIDYGQLSMYGQLSIWTTVHDGKSIGHAWAAMDNCPCMDIHKIVHAWITPCTLVVASHARYALVNIVMGDIADIEKKKSKGLSTLLLSLIHI